MKRLNTFVVILTLILPTLLFSQRQDCEDTRAFLGVHSNEISRTKAELLGFDNPYGSYITSIIGNTAAEVGGLAPFDYIYGINEYRADRNEDLSDMLSHFQSGDEVIIHFYRNGQPMSQLVNLSSRSNSKSRKRSAAEDPHMGISDDDDNDNELGVRVDVSRGSTAETLGLDDGDVITAINGHPIIDWSDVSTAIDAMEVGQTIAVEYERDGDLRNASGPIQSRSATQQVYAEKAISMTRNSGAFLGIYSNTLSREKAKKLGFENQYGSYVSGVIGNTAAERAGIQPFDYIYGIDEYRTGSRQNLGDILHKYDPGETAKVYYVRKSQDRSSNITFGTRSEAVYQELDKCEEPFFGVSGDHTRSWSKGVPVQIVSNSTASSLGMQNRDVIISINDFPIIDWEDISTAIDNMQVGQNIRVSYMRDNKEITGIQAIKSYCETKGLSGIDNLKIGMNKDLSFSGVETVVEEKTFKAVDFSNVSVNVQDMSSEDSQQLRNTKGLNLSSGNTLRVNNLRLSPDPHKGLFQLSFSLPENGLTRIQIFNTSGRTIYDYDLGNYTGNFEDEVDISQNGTTKYFLTVSQDNRVMAKKIVLQKG